MLRGTSHFDNQGISMECGVQEPFFDIESDYGFYDDLEDMRSDTETSTGDSGVHNKCWTQEDSSQILTPSIIEELSLQDQKLDCLFSSSRDGSSFGTFMRHVRGYARTIVVAKADDGKVYGAYAIHPWSGRHTTGGGAKDSSFLFEVPSSNSKKGFLSPLAQPSSHGSFGSFIPGLDKNFLGTSPTSSMDFDMVNLSLATKHAAKVGVKIDILKSSVTSCGFKQVCQLGRKFIGISDGDVSLGIEDSFSRGSFDVSMKDKREFNVVGFEVYAVSE